MNLQYSLTIENPEHHYVQVRISGEKAQEQEKVHFFMPSWSPGSYLMREYSQNVRRFQALTKSGETLWFSQVDKGTWCIDWQKSELKNAECQFDISYEVYCHELTVRTSHMDNTHAFIHGPSVFMGVVDEPMPNPTLAVKFPPCWSKITTGLKDISPKREEFLYTAENYDLLIDTPLEIGCHETDGFRIQGIDHELAFYGNQLPNKEDFKKDIKIILETVLDAMVDIPYEKYTIITHFLPEKFGGLEHHNSTALQFCSMNLANRDGYINWLALVAHEYFHTWNIKRIRPKELGPFDYRQEAMTRMLWLAEGLTSFMDEAFVLRSGLCTLEEYLKMQIKNLNRYYSTPGRMFHTLEDSSFNAWIKLYRPNENTANSSISYYLKGGIAFWVLNSLFYKEGKSMDDLLHLLWDSYKKNPEVGLEDYQVYEMIEKVAGAKVKDQFMTMVQTTEEIDLEKHFKDIGLQIDWESSDRAWLGANLSYEGDRAIVKSVILDGPAQKSGLNAGDEIIAINGLRILRGNAHDEGKFLLPDHVYKITVSRLNTLMDVDVLMTNAPRTIKGITIVDREKVMKAMGVKNH